MAQLTARGYLLKTQNEYFADEVQLYRNIDVEWNLDPSTPDGLKIAHDAEVFGALDEVLHQAYLSKDPRTATGYDLDIVAYISDVKREQGSRSNVELKLTGVPGTLVEAGKRVSSSATGERWIIEEGIHIDDNGEAWVNAYSERIGMIEADAHTLINIVDSVGGWTGVTNPNIATPGRVAESDGALRLRRAQSVAKNGTNQIDATKGAIYNVDGVRRCEMYENDTDVVDEIGLPPHSTCILVDGGTDEEVARVIYNKRTPGTKQFIESTTTGVEIEIASERYPSSRKQLIKFARPKYIDVKLNVKIKDDGSLPANVSDIIIESIMEFTNGYFMQDCGDGFKRNGFEIGENVPINSLTPPINRVLGQYGNAYIESIAIQNVTSGMLVLSPFELTRWTSSNMNIEVV